MTVNNNPKTFIGNHKEKRKWNSGTAITQCTVSFPKATKAKRKLDEF